MDHYYDDDDDDNTTRRRRPSGGDHSDAGLYNELHRLRSLVDVIEGDSNRGGMASCFPISLDNSIMSTVFGLIFVTIVTVTIYAFNNLFVAISKRFFTKEPEF